MTRPIGCPDCGGAGTLIDRKAGTWDVCKCPAESAVTAEIKQGEADIKAGRLHRWDDVRRDL